MMDLDEAIKHCEEVAEKQDKLCEISVTERAKEQNSRCADEHRQLAEWLKELKAYKEQSGDAISREAVDDAIYDYSRSCNVDYSQIMEYIEKLPSVTPQQRTGRWIVAEVLDKIRERVELEKLGYPPSAGYYRAIMKVLQIIDKYKAESEDEE